MKTGTFMMNCRDFFGLKNGQTPIEFGKEIRQLTDKDRAEIQAGLEMQHGYTFIKVGEQVNAAMDRIGKMKEAAA